MHRVAAMDEAAMKEAATAKLHEAIEKVRTTPRLRVSKALGCSVSVRRIHFPVLTPSISKESKYACWTMTPKTNGLLWWFVDRAARSAMSERGRKRKNGSVRSRPSVRATLSKSNWKTQEKNHRRVAQEAGVTVRTAMLRRSLCTSLRRIRRRREEMGVLPQRLKTMEPSWKR